LALSRLNVKHRESPDSASMNGSPTIARLVRLFRFTETVRNLQTDGNEVKLLSSLSSLEPETFAAMDTKALVGLVLNCKGDAVDLFARYRTYLVPLMKERLSARYDDKLYAEIDVAIEQFCVSLVTDCRRDGKILVKPHVHCKVCKSYQGQRYSYEPCVDARS
jgi:hypothetical protein